MVGIADTGIWRHRIDDGHHLRNIVRRNGFINGYGRRIRAKGIAGKIGLLHLNLTCHINTVRQYKAAAYPSNPATPSIDTVLPGRARFDIADIYRTIIGHIICRTGAAIYCQCNAWCSHL